MSKLRIGISSAVILLVALTGCAAPGGFQNSTPAIKGNQIPGGETLEAKMEAVGNAIELSAGDIRVNLLKASEDIDAYRFAMTLNSNISGPMLSAVNQKTEINGSLDMTKKKMRIDISLTRDAGAGDTGAGNSEAEIYVDGSRMFLRSGGQDLNEDWQEQVTPESLWQEQDVIRRQILLMEDAEWELIGLDQTQGMSCYRVNITPAASSFKPIIEQLSGVPGLDQEVDIDRILQGIKIEAWVDRDTFWLQKLEEKMELTLEPEEMGIQASGDSPISIKTTLEIAAFDYNGLTEIEKPDGLK